jgi:uncharacterized protein
MLYFIHCIDKPDSLELRMANRDAHLDYIKDFRVFTAGPKIAADGKTMIGSVIIIDCESDDALQDYVKNDPYTKCGLFSSVETTGWKKVIHDPEV